MYLVVEIFYLFSLSTHCTSRFRKPAYSISQIVVVIKSCCEFVNFVFYKFTPVKRGYSKGRRHWDTRIVLKQNLRHTIGFRLYTWKGLRDISVSLHSRGVMWVQPRVCQRQFESFTMTTGITNKHICNYSKIRTSSIWTRFVLIIKTYHEIVNA